MDLHAAIRPPRVTGIGPGCVFLHTSTYAKRSSASVGVGLEGSLFMPPMYHALPCNTTRKFRLTGRLRGHGKLLHGWLQNRRGGVVVYLTIGGPPFVDSTTTEHGLALTELSYPSVVSPPLGREWPKADRARSDRSARCSSVRLRWRLRHRRRAPASYSLPST